MGKYLNTNAILKSHGKMKVIVMSLSKIVVLMLFVPFIFPSMAGSGEIVKAKVGVEIIQKGNGTNSKRKARAINDLKKDDMLTVVVKPEQDSFVYIINSNEQDSVLLNPDPKGQRVKKAQKRVFPNVGQLYKLETTRNKELLIVIVSPDENEQIKSLFASETVSKKEWKTLESELIQSSSLLSDDRSEERKKFGGTVRGSGSTVIKHRTAAGKGLIVKKYQFNVKK